MSKKFMPNELPDSVETDITVLYYINGWQAGELYVAAYDCDGDKDRIVLVKTKLTVDLTPAKQVDITKLAIDSLDNAIKTAQAEAFKKISELEAVREKFLQLTYKPKEEVLPPGEPDEEVLPRHGGQNWEEPLGRDLDEDDYDIPERSNGEAL